MADIYVRSTDGNDADNGSTWALAKATLTGAANADTAGDNIYLSSVHSDTTSAAIILNFAGTTASPVKVISANDSAEPPTTAAIGAVVSTTGNSSITINGCVYMYGITFNCGTGANSVSLNLNNTTGFESTYEKCTFNLVGTGGSAVISTTPGSSNCKTMLKDCDVRFYSASGKINPNRGILTWDGGSLVSGTSSPTVLFGNGSASGRCEILVSGVDLSAAGSSMNIFQGDGGGGHYVIRNSKLPASWSGSLLSGTIAAGARAEMHNCDSADTNYRFWIEDFAGSVKSETTLVKSGGSSDGTTPYSMKMTTSANAEYPTIVLKSPDISKWNEVVGSSIVVTVDILSDSVANLQDNDVWLEVQYLGTSGFPVTTVITDSKSNPLVASADQDTSTATWTTTGMSNPNEQKLSVTLTPQEKGYIQARVCSALASTTIYADVTLQVS